MVSGPTCVPRTRLSGVLRSLSAIYSILMFVRFLLLVLVRNRQHSQTLVQMIDLARVCMSSMTVLHTSVFLIPVACLHKLPLTASLALLHSPHECLRPQVSTFQQSIDNLYRSAFSNITISVDASSAADPASASGDGSGSSSYEEGGSSRGSRSAAAALASALASASAAAVAAVARARLTFDRNRMSQQPAKTVVRSFADMDEATFGELGRNEPEVGCVLSCAGCLCVTTRTESVSLRGGHFYIADYKSACTLRV